MKHMQPQTGLARLLNPYRIYDADYNSMTMDVRSRCSVNGGTGTSGKECLAYDVDATFGLVLVIDPLRVGDSRGNMMDEQAQALGDQSQTVHVLPTLDCSLRSLFDRTLPTAQCPGTTVSRVLIEMDGRDAAELVTKADTTLMTKVDRHSSWAVYDMLREGRECKFFVR